LHQEHDPCLGPSSATTASTSIILAIDLGKYKRVACLHDQNGGEIRFTTFDTSRHEPSRTAKADHQGTTGRHHHRGLSYGLLAGWVHDLCGDLGVRCQHRQRGVEAWKFKHLKRKTDKDDALRLAQLYLLGPLPTVTLPPTRCANGGR
jgi:hypothetical protein